MDLYNYRKVTEYWLSRIRCSYPSYADTVSRFIDALRLAGIGEAKVKDYAQLSLRILECSSSSSSNDSKSSSKHVREWSRDDIDRMVLLT
jgi:hypothetical protein